ncbi:DNA repair protein RecO [candidate division BRC1 bacterium HGW-BRC1-1]|jgi:DNA repair protein RecO|nr:MAG: DNA repair protein RecO [candidate division BRC1 bacterium HGW-BRC1-1]
MAMVQGARAFVLDVRDYRESSALVRLLVQGEGLVSLVGRGMRSVRKGASAPVLQPFALVHLSYSLRDPDGLGALRSAEVERQYDVLRTNIEAYALAGAWFEILLASAQPGPEGDRLFGLTEGFMNQIQMVGSAVAREPIFVARDASVLWYWARLLNEMGVGPQFGVCGRCGSKLQLHHFDLRGAETVCADCAAEHRRYLPLTGADVRGLQAVFSRSIPKDRTPLPQRSVLLFLRIVRDVMRRHLEMELKSFGFLSEVLGGKF